MSNKYFIIGTEKSNNSLTVINDEDDFTEVRPFDMSEPEFPMGDENTIVVISNMEIAEQSKVLQCIF